MNTEQLEEYEALTYIFTSNEMECEGNVLEFKMNECDGLRLQIIWPANYPSCALIFTVIDPRVKKSLRTQIDQECNELV